MIHNDYLLDPKGRELCQLDDLYIVEENRDCVFPAALETAPPNIELYHRRFGYLRLDNVRATLKIITRIEFTENKEPEVTKVCNSCELAKLTRYTRKGTNKRETKVGMKLYINVVRLKLKGIKNQH